MVSLSLTLVQIGNGGLLLVLTQYLQFVLGYSLVKAGMAFLPLAVTALAATWRGAEASRRRPATGCWCWSACCVMAASFALLSTVGADMRLRHPGGRPRPPRSGRRPAMPAAIGRADGHHPGGEGWGRLGAERHHPAGGHRARHRDPRLDAGGQQERNALRAARLPGPALDRQALAAANGDQGLVHAAREAFATAIDRVPRSRRSAK
ncbi:hypothetical protein ACU686_30870 [Yinghuangia aomiensis]